MGSTEENLTIISIFCQDLFNFLKIFSHINRNLIRAFEDIIWAEF